MSSYEETYWCAEPGRDASVPRADLKHHELKSFGRFWYREIRDFLNSKHTAQPTFRVFELQVSAATPTPLLCAALGLSCRRLATAVNEKNKRFS
jgi:hypothetical protein